MMQSQPWIDQYKNELGTRESVSGYGSSLANTAEIRRALPVIFEQYGIHKIVDIPCGDWNWMQKVDLSTRYYIGCDVVPGLIDDNIKQFGGPHTEFKVLDLITDVPPVADLILCRDFLFHISNSRILSCLANIRQSAKYLLATSFPNVVNRDLNCGDAIGWRKIDLCSAPFNLPDPEYIVQENNSEACQGRIVGLFRMEK